MLHQYGWVVLTSTGHRAGSLRMAALTRSSSTLATWWGCVWHPTAPRCSSPRHRATCSFCTTWTSPSRWRSAATACCEREGRLSAQVRVATVFKIAKMARTKHIGNGTCPRSLDGGTSASRSAGTPRHGSDSSKIHPHREGQRWWQKGEATLTHSSSVFTLLRLSRPFAEEQPGGLDPRDPWREGPGQLHHLPAASPERLGHAHQVLQQHGRPGGETDATAGSASQNFSVFSVFIHLEKDKAMQIGKLSSMLSKWSLGLFFCVKGELMVGWMCESSNDAAALVKDTK